MAYNILTSSPSRNMSKNVKHLTFGCLDISDQNGPKNVLINHPWENIENFNIDKKKINKIQNFTLKKFSKILNNHFKIKKNLRY